MTMPEVVDYFERYAASFAAPVRSGIDGARRDARRRRASTSARRAGEWRAPAVVVIATGLLRPPCGARVSPRGFPSGITHVVPTAYRGPTQLPDGGVLVVGASASGIQLADELHRAGRPVTLAVGHHTRLPRRYRGRDILWWLDRMGLFDETVDQVYDVEISREQPSLQLVGHPDHVTLDLAGLRERGVRVVGTPARTSTAASRASPTTWWRRRRRPTSSWPACCSASTRSSRAQAIDAAPARAFRAALPPLRRCRDRRSTSRSGHPHGAVGDRLQARSTRGCSVPVLDARGEIRHSGGVTPEPGLYVLGLHFLRRRKSSLHRRRRRRCTACWPSTSRRYLAGRSAAVA